jgi:hypothetical protein
MGRAEHEFQFAAEEIATAAAAEASYHEGRETYWAEEFDKSFKRVKETAGVEVKEVNVTGGKRFDVAVDYGDMTAYRRMNEASQKMQTHREAAEKYRSDAKVYGSQNGRMYELTADDVHYFRLGDGEREG